MADACAPLWGRTLKILQAQLQKRLRDYAQGEAQSCWPSLGRLLLLRLVGHIFSVTDYHHAIVEPTILLLCQCMSQCPVGSAKDIASGILCSSILIGFTAESGRIVPECHTFLGSVLAVFSVSIPSLADVMVGHRGLASSAVPQKRKALGLQIQPTFDIVRLAGLRQAAAQVTEPLTEAEELVREGSDAASSSQSPPPASTRVPWACFKKASSSSASEHDPVTAAGIFSATHRLVTMLLKKFRRSDALPELMGPLVDTLRAVRPHDSPRMPDALMLAHVTQLEATVTATSTKRSSRARLQWRKPVKEAIEGKNPRFQVDYKLKKDVDPDEERVKVKQLNRQLKREQKAAMRELRRDADFLEQEKHREQEEVKSKLREERNRNFAWMESEQASINQQVRMGKGLLHKGGGSGIVQKARVKR